MVSVKASAELDEMMGSSNVRKASICSVSTDVPVTDWCTLDCFSEISDVKKDFGDDVELHGNDREMCSWGQPEPVHTQLSAIYESVSQDAWNSPSPSVMTSWASLQKLSGDTGDRMSALQKRRRWNERAPLDVNGILTELYTGVVPAKG